MMDVQESVAAIQKLIDTAIQFAVNYGFQVIRAILILMAGFIAGDWINHGLLKSLTKKCRCHTSAPTTGYS